MKINRFVGINMSEKMYEELQKESEALGLNISSYVRLIISKRKK